MPPQHPAASDGHFPRQGFRAQALKGVIFKRENGQEMAFFAPSSCTYDGLPQFCGLMPAAQELMLLQTNQALGAAACPRQRSPNAAPALPPTHRATPSPRQRSPWPGDPLPAGTPARRGAQGHLHSQCSQSAQTSQAEPRPMTVPQQKLRFSPLPTIPTTFLSQGCFTPLQ